MKTTEQWSSRARRFMTDVYLNHIVSFSFDYRAFGLEPGDLLEGEKSMLKPLISPSDSKDPIISKLQEFYRYGNTECVLLRKVDEQSGRVFVRGVDIRNTSWYPDIYPSYQTFNEIHGARMDDAGVMILNYLCWYLDSDKKMTDEKFFDHVTVYPHGHATPERIWMGTSQHQLIENAVLIELDAVASEISPSLTVTLKHRYKDHGGYHSLPCVEYVRVARLLCMLWNESVISTRTPVYLDCLQKHRDIVGTNRIFTAQLTLERILDTCKFEDFAQRLTTDTIMAVLLPTRSKQRG